MDFLLFFGLQSVFAQKKDTDILLVGILIPLWYLFLKSLICAKSRLMPTMSACADDEKIIPYKASICQVLFSYISEENCSVTIDVTLKILKKW